MARAEPRYSLPTPKIVQEAERLGELTDGDQRMRSQYEIFQKLDKAGKVPDGGALPGQRRGLTLRS